MSGGGGSAMLLAHIVAGALALVAGFVALAVSKGSALHRRSGRVFVYAMVTMGVSGAVIAALTGVSTSVLMGSLAAYLVVTGFTAVRPTPPAWRILDIGVMAVGLSVGLMGFVLGVRALAPDAPSNDMPVPMFFAFGAIALLAAISDARVILGRSIRGRPRMTRHLWRMCLGLFIASGSFFLGQADEIPEPLRVVPLLVIPVLLPLLAIPYWLWRLRGHGGRRLPIREARAAARPRLLTRHPSTVVHRRERHTYPEGESRMKSIGFILAVALMTVPGAGFAQQPAAATTVATTSATQESFAALKSLVGEWEGTVTVAEMPEMTPKMHVSIRETSRGNVIVHEFQEAGTLLDATKYDHPVTMFYVDQDQLELVHFCDAGNRPRMVGTRSEDGKTFAFEVVEIGGDPTYHMHNIVFTVIDENHHVEEFTFMMGDKPMHARLDLKRTDTREDWTARVVAAR